MTLVVRRLVAKILITTIQVNLMLNCSEATQIHLKFHS